MTTTMETSPFSPTELIDRLRDCLLELLRERPVMLAYLYGSQVEGRTTRFSDIDIALVLNPKHGLSAYERFMLELMIGDDLDTRYGIRGADVRSIDNAPLRVQGRILTQGQLLYSRNEDFRVDYEVHTRRLYFDFLPVLDMMREAYFERSERELRAKGLYVG